MASPVKRIIKQEFDEIHENTSTELISITADKLKLILTEHLEKVESSNMWHVPLSIFITILLVFCSAEFKQALGLSADTWCALFVIFGLMSLVWLIHSLQKIRRRTSLDQVIDKIKNK